MKVSLIVAVSENGVIGKDDGIPWRLPADQQMFKQATMGHHLILGRKTYESIGRPLPGREMIVLSRQACYSVPGCQTAVSLDQALMIAKAAGETEVFIGGGAAIYEQALPIADRLYFTQVHATVDGDTFFPEFDRGDWVETERAHYPANEKQEHTFTFFLLEK